MNTLPDTPLVREAVALVRSPLTTALFCHSQRVFVLGRAFASVRRVAFEEEDLMLAALFHDLGLTESHASPKRAFNEVGGDLLQAWLTERGEPARGRQLAEAIDLHMQLLPRWSRGAVVGLLQVGAWMDVSRTRASQIDNVIIERAEAQFPRDGFDSEFHQRLRGSLRSFRSCTGLILPRRRARVDC
jgi:hypothetical protein